MTELELLNYKLNQSDLVKRNSSYLRKQGCVKNYRDVYPDVYDRIHKQRGTAYIRGNVPLKLMAILYDTVIVSVPPFSKKQLENRFDLEWEDFLRLCDHNIIIPVIGDADNYKGKHFEDLFHLCYPPCSLLARGLALLDVFGMEDSLTIVKDILPVDKMAHDPSIIQHWRKRYPNTSDDEIICKIQRDIALNYADLCIFGLRSEATDLARLPPKKIYETLKLMNEIKTYPVLFGMNSQANFNYKRLHNLSSIEVTDSTFKPLALPKKELEILYEGIGIDVTDIKVDTIIKYHNDSLGMKLRAALSNFNSYCDRKISRQESLSTSQVCERAEAFQKEFKIAVRELDSHKYAKIGRTSDALTNVLKIGTIVLGTVIAKESSSQLVDVLSIIGTPTAIVSKLPEETAELIIRMGLLSTESKSKFVANMWSAKRIVGGK